MSFSAPEEEVAPAVLLLCSSPPDAADGLARTLVESRLAACVSVLPSMQSTYRWEGKLEQSNEALLLIKTRSDRVPALRERLLELHPYELPELLGVPIDAKLSSLPYLGWVARGSSEG